jgi:uncharacterized repeat protein (TIGR03943 family)
MSRTASRQTPSPSGTIGSDASASRWNHTRLAGGVLLSAWAIMFWFLFVTGRVNLYLSTRTSWVVPVGAVLFTAGAIGTLLGARRGGPAPLSRREASVMTLMVVPVVIVLALPPATLGSFSAAKRTSFSSARFSSIYGSISASSEITLLSVAAAQTSDQGAQALAKRAGAQVDFVGMVTRYADTPPDEFLLTRFVITCCVADATVAQVRVVNVTPGRFRQNEWVEVKGPIYPLGREVIVSATSIDPVPVPEKPYLTP